jgi:hypothetical protein
MASSRVLARVTRLRQRRKGNSLDQSKEKREAPVRACAAYMAKLQPEAMVEV